MVPENWCSWQSLPTRFVKDDTLLAHPIGLHHSDSVQPLSGRERPPEQVCQPGPGVTPLPAGHRTDKQLSRESRMGKNISMYKCWNRHSATAQGSLLQGSKLQRGSVTRNCCRGKDLIHGLTFLMGSCVLNHLVKLSHQHHFLQPLGFPLEVSGTAERSGALHPPSG